MKLSIKSLIYKLRWKMDILLKIEEGKPMLTFWAIVSNGRIEMSSLSETREQAIDWKPVSWWNNNVKQDPKNNCLAKITVFVEGEK